MRHKKYKSERWINNGEICCEKTDKADDCNNEYYYIYNNFNMFMW